MPSDLDKMSRIRSFHTVKVETNAKCRLNWAKERQSDTILDESASIIRRKNKRLFISAGHERRVASRPVVNVTHLRSPFDDEKRAAAVPCRAVPSKWAHFDFTPRIREFKMGTYYEYYASRGGGAGGGGGDCRIKMQRLTDFDRYEWTSNLPIAE
ncbi:hypothetical protein V9T40_014237 [Parthenolecanium corni]|uniref:Uncharacterized protein n=1 Tax=Parthenolecanium corni TaxID=536013 RepID=A0AAN9Y215_9HEMI